jgi:hypothetical protein
MEERRGLLGAWSPPAVTTPLTMVASNELDGRLGVGLGIDDSAELEHDAPTVGGRDRGVHDDSYDWATDKGGGLPLETVAQQNGVISGCVRI